MKEKEKKLSGKMMNSIWDEFGKASWTIIRRF